MQANIKIIKDFGQIDGVNVFALYIRTTESVEKIFELQGKTVEIGMEHPMAKKKREVRARPSTVKEAKKLIESGKKPVEVESILGIGLSTAYKLHREYKAKHPDPPKAKVINPRPKEGPVTVSYMTPADIKKYGPPRKPLSNQ